MSLEGVWKSRGYGWLLEIAADRYALYDDTPSACVEFERGTRAELDAAFELAVDGDALRLRIRNDITAYEFRRAAALPPPALAIDAPRLDDPCTNLGFFCEAFAQDYAFFDLRRVDWQSACAIARSSVDAGSSKAALFAALHALITPLADNHVMLSDGATTVNSEKVADIKALLQRELALDNPGIAEPDTIAKLVPYLREEFLGGAGEVAGNGAVIWGALGPALGYLNVLRLFGLADTAAARSARDLPPRRPDHARFLRDDLDAIGLIMDRVMADLGDSDAIVLDVRINGGGFDNVGMAIANCFADRRRLAFTKQARDGAGLTPRQEFFIEPAGEAQFTRPVYVLTSARTASAGDVFALCMRSLPHVTLVGQPSTGILSDNLRKHLPNGWITSLSNELYRAADGELFEGPGVPVDVETPVFVPGDFRAGYRIAVDTARELSGARALR